MDKKDYVCDNDNCETLIDIEGDEHIELDIRLMKTEETLEYYYCSIECCKEETIRELDKIKDGVFIDVKT